MAGKIIGRIIGEALSDMSDTPDAVLEFYMTQLSGIVYWCATGDIPEEIPMPPDLAEDIRQMKT
jgi:hypothetical protein